MTARKPRPVAPPPLLEVLKVQLLAAIDDARSADRPQPAAVAALSRELRAVQAELEAKAGPGEVSKADDLADDLAKRRAARVADTEDRAPTARRGQPRRSNGNHRTG